MSRKVKKNLRAILIELLGGNDGFPSQGIQLARSGETCCPARGVMEKARFKKLFEAIEMVTQGFNQCKVLVDLAESTYAVNSVEIDSLVAELPLDRWPPSNRIAFVSATGIADYHR